MKLFDIFKKKQKVVLTVPKGYTILVNGIDEYKWENSKTLVGSTDYRYDQFKSYEEALKDLNEHVNRLERNELRDHWQKVDKKS